MENTYYKVAESGYSLTMATFYNPVTGAEFSEIVWDNDDDRLLSDPRLQELRFAPMAPENVMRQWHHAHGNIFPGDTVMVVKGRKVPVGTVSKVVKIKPFTDCYGRWRCDYAYLENGTRTNVDNCVLVVDV